MRLYSIENSHTGEWQRFQPVGETDFEVAFCILLERLASVWGPGLVPSVDARLAIVASFATDMRKLGPANFLYSDGDVLFVHGHRRTQQNGTIAPPGLWCLSRRCPAESDELSQAGIVIESPDQAQEVLLFASVPLTDEGWRPLTEGEVVVAKDGRVLKGPSSL